MINPLDWVPADGLTLEPNALKAILELKRCLALTAGPGAGKTEMLAQRADFLLRTGSCRYPKRILAISFKVDASRNLKDRVRRRCGPELSARFDSYTFHAFAKRIIDRFRSVLVGQDALDPDYKIGASRVTRKQIEFGDLVPFAIQILTSSTVARNAIRQTYSDIFLDEFQDCTTDQYELLKLAFLSTSIRLTAVGDTKQKIMAWAGALDGIFVNFAHDFDALPLNMYRNFRSKPRLLRMQNEIVRVFDSAAVMSDEQLKGEEGEIYLWPFESSQAEATYLADQISDWIVQERIPPSEIAILVSQQPDLYASHLMLELSARGIPFRNEQLLQDLSVEPVARLIVDYLLSLYGTREPAAWMRLMNQLIAYSDDEGEASARQDWQRFIKAERKKANEVDAVDDCFSVRWPFVISFLKKVGIDMLTGLSPDYESRTRLNDVIKETKARIEDLSKTEPNLLKTLARFSDDQAVRILTIHKSKGLEFEVVVILGVEKETFWGDQDERRCAFFVGISRAKTRLALTWAKKRERPQGWTGGWNTSRIQHDEYVGYALPFLSTS